jgi:hypothetical protein
MFARGTPGSGSRLVVVNPNPLKDLALSSGLAIHPLSPFLMCGLNRYVAQPARSGRVTVFVGKIRICSSVIHCIQCCRHTLPLQSHTRMKAVRIVTVLSSAWFLTGCGAILHGSRQDIAVQSSVPGATVQAIPSAVAVAAPGTISLERKNNYVLTFTAPGYAPANVNVTNSIGVGTVIADVLLTGLVGVVVDGLTGSWYGLNPETATATLVKQVGAIGPDEIHIQLGHVTSKGQMTVKADAPGVAVQVTRN